MSKLDDAAIATDPELNRLAGEFGTFAVAEKTTMMRWVGDRRQELLWNIGKTKGEVQRLQSALQYLERVLSSLGRPHSTRDIERAYHALEGWALTLVANYAALAGNLSRRDREALFKRLQMYTEGAIANHRVPGARAGEAKMNEVRGVLGDHAVMDR